MNPALQHLFSTTIYLADNINPSSEAVRSSTSITAMDLLAFQVIPMLARWIRGWCGNIWVCTPW